ncbi:unnamed protein product, partial [Ectocarpus sp. 12 AP-2014]
VRSYPERTEQWPGFTAPEIDTCGDKDRVDWMLAGSGLDAVLRGDVDVLGIAAASGRRVGCPIALARLPIRCCCRRQHQVLNHPSGDPSGRGPAPRDEQGGAEAEPWSSPGRPLSWRGRGGTREGSARSLVDMVQLSCALADRLVRHVRCHADDAIVVVRRVVVHGLEVAGVLDDVHICE